MFGYVRPAMEKLSPDERKRFNATYCGLCHTLGKRYGFTARFILNYDFTLLAILLSDPRGGACRACACVASPCKKKCVLQTSLALELAADDSVILAWWQLRDGVADHGFWRGLKYRFLSLLLRRAYRKARTLRPAFDDWTRQQLAALSALEARACDSLDETADAFASLLSGAVAAVEDTARRRVLEQILYHLGRWVYLVDAADDLQKDCRSGSYNPLRYRFALTGAQLPDEDAAALSATLDHSVRVMASAYALCDFGCWTAILDSIFYEGLYVVGNAVLSGTFRKSAAFHRNARQETIKEEKL